MARGIEVDRNKITVRTEARASACIDLDQEVDDDLDDLDLRDLAEDKIEDAAARTRGKPNLLRAPIAAMTGTKVLEQFFGDKPKPGAKASFDKDTGRPCRVCKQKIRPRSESGDCHPPSARATIPFDEKWLKRNTVSSQRQLRFFAHFTPDEEETDTTHCSTCQAVEPVSNLEVNGQQGVTYDDPRGYV